jgi:phenylpropionate dioxygenase-like ring-hydroxylating dioxygenase large terminal subunit
VGDRVQCPFHLWQYSTDGICKTGSGGELGKKRLAVEEREGIVFVFSSAQPTFGFPKYSRTERPVSGAVMTKTLKTPHQALIFNGFDSYHLERIHNRTITAPIDFSSKATEHLRADFSMKVLEKRFYDFVVRLLGSHEQNFYLDCWGGNTVIITNARTRDNIIITSVPFEANLSRIFIYAVTDRAQSWWRRAANWLRLSLTAYLGEKFLDPDVRIVENMRPLERQLVPELDWPVEKFWQYFDNLPRA